MMPLLGKFSLKARIEGSQSSQIGGGKLDDTVTLPNLFLSEVWDVEQWETQHTPRNLSIGPSVCPGLCGYDQLCILKSVL